MAASGDVLIGTSPDKTDGLCISSDSSSFQPIQTQVAIPTAHVMPSMFERSSCRVGETNTPQTTLASSLPTSSGDAGGFPCTQDTVPLRQTQLYYSSPLHLHQSSVEHGCDKSLFLTSEQTNMGHAQKPVRLAAELTYNQSSFLDRQSTGPWTQLQMYNPDTPITGLEKESCKGPLGAKTEANKIYEKQASLGLNPASICSRSTGPQSQMWKQDACALHPNENCALNAWNQHLDTIRLQLEQMQLQNKPSCYHPLVNNSSLHNLDPPQWVSIVNANEKMLREKEVLIDRQRQHISQLEQKVRESELQVHNALLGHPTTYGDLYLLRMQELQRENIFLRAQFTEKTELLGKEKIELERKLAAAEAGIKQIQEAHKDTVQKHAVELKKQEERVKARDKHIEHLKKKFQKENDQNREKQQRIETLERYVADLPMLEDHQKLNQQLKESQQAATTFQETVTALEKQLGETRASCREKELQLEMQKHKEMELLSTVRSLQDKMQRGKSLAADDNTQEVERVKREKEALQKERDLLRKIVENQKKKMEQLTLEVKDLEEQIAQEESTGQALKAEALRQEHALQQLRTAVKELSAQNQELMEKNLTFQENLNQAVPEQLLSYETTQLMQQLHSELGSCLEDLQSVYSIVTQRAQGKDPNLSLLLGIHTVHCSVKDKEDLLKPDMLAKKLEDVKKLRKEIEDLRTAISDRYAQDMGDNCITQ